MCIVCNANGSGLDDAFLGTFASSQREMKRAAKLMMELSEHRLTNPNAKPAYRQAHKAMRRIMREWNKIEQQREQAVEQRTPKP